MVFNIRMISLKLAKKFRCIINCIKLMFTNLESMSKYGYLIKTSRTNNAKITLLRTKIHTW